MDILDILTLFTPVKVDLLPITHTHTHTHTHRAYQRNFPNIQVLFPSNTGPLHPFQDQPPNPCLDPISYRSLKNHNTSGVYTLSLQYHILFLFIGSFSITLKLLAAAAAAKSLQSCLTLCDPIDSSPPGSPVPGILQARTLEWVAISLSNA